MKKKKKNFVIIYENFLYGGTTTHLINLVKSKSFKDLNITIITNQNNIGINDIKKKIKSKKVKLVFLNTLNGLSSKNVLVKLIILFLKPFLFFISIFQFKKYLKVIDYDILLANCGGYGNFRTEVAGLIASHIIGKKKNYLLIHHQYRKPFFWNFLIRWIDHFIFKIVKKIIFVSNATKHSVIKNSGFSLENINKFRVIHNGVSITGKKKKAEKMFHVKKGITKIGMLSRIEKYKGQEDLIKSVSLLDRKYKKKIQLFLIGNGDKKSISSIKNYIKNNNLEKIIKIRSFIEKDSEIILKNLDLFLSLTRDFEGFGYSIAEAMLYKVPVIATNVGGTKEFLNSQNANIVKPRDINMIKRLIIDYLENRTRWIKKAKFSSRFISKKFNSEIMSKKFKEVLK